MPSKQDYAAEASRLAKAIDIAIDSFKKYPPDGWNDSHILHIVKVYSEWKYDALNPTPEYRRLSSLKQIIHEAFTFFQEATGEAVEYFWKRVAEEELGYERVDRLRKILDRGKLKGRLEFDAVIDTFIAAQQEGRITQEEASRLKEIISDFEKRKK